jgi:tRNA dimethylallyltransferase
MHVVLTGPTASGKSALAVELALHPSLARSVDILSMDSTQVYRGLDIGTAKPDLAIRAAIPHHLIDLIDPHESFSAARFRAEALATCVQIREKERQALFVGGTLLYGRALEGGLSDLPPSDPAVREAIAAQAACDGWPTLHAQLARADPDTAARLAPRDAQRISRALEVLQMTGKPLSEWHAEAAKWGTEKVRWISLEPSDRVWLHNRIRMRLDRMLADGLIEEVRGLIARPAMHSRLPSMRAVGYRQCAQWLREGAGEVSVLRDRILAATRQFAKRQLTWLRSMPDREVYACDTPSELRRALDALREGLDHARDAGPGR